MGLLTQPPTPLIGYPGVPRPVGRGTAGDRWGATAVSGSRATVEKETADQPLKPAASRETVGALRIQWFNYQVSRDMFKFALRLGIVDDEHN